MEDKELVQFMSNSDQWRDECLPLIRYTPLREDAYEVGFLRAGYGCTVFLCVLSGWWVWNVAVAEIRYNSFDSVVADGWILD